MCADFRRRGIHSSERLTPACMRLTPSFTSAWCTSHAHARSYEDWSVNELEFHDLEETRITL